MQVKDWIHHHHHHDTLHKTTEDEQTLRQLTSKQENKSTTRAQNLLCVKGWRELVGVALKPLTTLPLVGL